VSLATRPLLDFQLAHARARDAVHAAIDVRMLCDELRRCGLTALALESQAKDRLTYLRRPDLGRALSADSAALLTPGDYDVVSWWRMGSPRWRWSGTQCNYYERSCL